MKALLIVPFAFACLCMALAADDHGHTLVAVSLAAIALFAGVAALSGERA